MRQVNVNNPLLPPFEFSNERGFTSTRSYTVQSNIFAFDLRAFKPDDDALAAYYKTNGTSQYANRYTVLTVMPFAGKSVRVEKVQTAPVMFTVEYSSVYFDAPDHPGWSTNHISTTGLFYDSCLYIPLDFIADAFGYAVETASAP